jgi:hypothetical protein
MSQFFSLSRGMKKMEEEGKLYYYFNHLLKSHLLKRNTLESERALLFFIKLIISVTLQKSPVSPAQEIESQLLPEWQSVTLQVLVGLSPTGQRPNAPH